MIYTVTFNPAIDYVMRTEKVVSGMVNRSESEEISFGGKGINVSVMLAELGEKSVALGFVAGFTGKAIEDALKEKGIKTDFVRLKSGNSRINVKIKAGEETEINGNGPDITEEDIAELLSKLSSLRKGDTLVIAGSVPSTVQGDIYERIMKSLSKEVEIVVDAEGRLLLGVLQYKPFLVKPNNIELGALFGARITTKEETVTYAKKLQNIGARNVLVSMAGDGAVLVDETGKVHMTQAPQGKVLNSVGAGDAMVAGFLAGYAKTCDYSYALTLGIATGSATAFSNGLAAREKVEELMNM